MFGFVPSKKHGLNRERVGVFVVVIAATDFGVEFFFCPSK